MSKELLSIVEVVANEKDVDRETIFGALEAALAAATRKRFVDEQIEARVSINRKNGEYETFRVWQIVDDEAMLENPDAEMREAVAEIEFPEHSLKAGDVLELPIENEPFGRISAQMAKQIIIQKLREAEREKIYQQFIDKEGSLIHGIIRRHEKGNVIVDVGGVEGTILRSDMIPRESLRNGDRVLGYLKKVNRELKGPQLQISRTVPEFLIQLFQKEVPEISSGNIEVMGAARDPGIRAKVAVRTFDPRIDPVGACVGIRGSRVQGVMNEMSGEGIDIVLWDEDPEQYVRKAMAPAEITDTLIDKDKHIIDVAVPEDKLARAVGKGGQNVRLASELTGWTINVLSESEFAQKAKAALGVQEQALAEVLGIDVQVATELLAANYTTPEEVAYADREDLLNIDAFDDNIVDALLERATDYLLTQAFVAASDPEAEMQTAITEMEGINEELAEKLLAKSVNTQEDLAELAVDELMNLSGLDKEVAAALILKAREPWFR
ncbi:transcription termination factor NusA [Suttonella ornithocola]|uniref:Transcription termination/antitermination protein NusA n=1 Tax=Suttonella ornithocola TaxID=279832 RepID=A0A380MX78_9GAMM|nr:transcription termination factor NusA [Suttonella ornithocola]SUO96321.1 Transcription elongation protein nusA [Suttonella ornithocola]